MVVIVDGDHLVSRVYHAVNYSGIDGQPAGAVFGFVRALKTICSQLAPSPIVICWGDKRSELWRREVYPEYKAHRSSAPADFVDQVKTLHLLLAGMGIPQILCKRYEADDLIATLANECFSAKVSAKIVTGDHDMFQLIRDGKPHIHVYVPVSGGYRKVTSADVMEKYGVTPSELPLYMAIKGERGDNIPGVQGIGRVRAKNLIRGRSEALAKVMEENKELITRNLVLVNLLTSPEVSLKIDSELPVLPRKFSELQVLSALRNVGLTGSKSLLAEVKEVVVLLSTILEQKAITMEDLLEEVA